jgi:hypothetical protein
VFLDIDARVTIARQHQIQVMPVLLDFHLCGCSHVVNDVQLGGRSRLIEDPAARSALVDFVLRPIIEHYREEEVIVAWDIMNEPEWCLGGDDASAYPADVVAWARADASAARDTSSAAS